MSRLLAHWLLLLYAGVFLHCQPVPVRAGSSGATGNAPQEQPRSGQCKKKLHTVQTDQQAAKQRVLQGKLLPWVLASSSDFAALYFGLLFPADAPTLNPARGPGFASAQAFANHPNKAPPVRFSQ